MTDRVQQTLQHLDIRSEESVSQVLHRIKEFDDLNFEEKVDLTKALTEVFYHVHHTGSFRFPKLAVNIEKRIVRFGSEMIPHLFNEILAADSESVVYFGQTLARQGAIGFDYLLKRFSEYQNKEQELINILQVLSYFKIPEAALVIPVLLSAAKSSNHQITSVALATVGKLVQKLPSSALGEKLREEIFDSAFRYLSNHQTLVRKNAVYALGMMMRKKILVQENETKLYKSFLAITGKDEHHNWDRAFIVRREAEGFVHHFKQLSHPAPKYAQHFKITSKKLLCENTYHFAIHAPLIAQKIEAGQFIIIRPHIFSERIPLSICGWDRTQGLLNIIVSAVGKTSTEINAMGPGDIFQDVVGPLGERSLLPKEKGTCVVIGGGYGTGAIIPTAKDLKALGNKVIGIVGARNESNLIMVDELTRVCDEVFVTTNDGSMGTQGFVTDVLRKILEREQVVYVLAVGPVPMMKAVSEMTRDKKIETYVSLNAIMVDGTGMCGACRVTVGGETKFACFHGPDFDGHKVDFENLMKRQKMFVRQEKVAFDNLKTKACRV